MGITTELTLYTACCVVMATDMSLSLMVLKSLSSMALCLAHPLFASNVTPRYFICLPSPTLVATWTLSLMAPSTCSPSPFASASCSLSFSPVHCRVWAGAFMAMCSHFSLFSCSPWNAQNFSCISIMFCIPRAPFANHMLSSTNICPTISGLIGCPCPNCPAPSPPSPPSPSSSSPVLS